MSKQTDIPSSPFHPDELLRKYSRAHIIKKLLDNDKIVNDIWDYASTRFVQGSKKHIVYRISVEESDIKIKVKKSVKSTTRAKTIINDRSITNKITNIAIKNEENEEKRVVVYSTVGRSGKLYLVHNTGHIEIVTSGIMPKNVRLIPMQKSDVEECYFSVNREDIILNFRNPPRLYLPASGCYVLYDGKIWIIASGTDIYMITKDAFKCKIDDYGLDNAKKFFHVR